MRSAKAIVHELQDPNYDHGDPERELGGQDDSL
jgi:hypothetical protein